MRFHTHQILTAISMLLAAFAASAHGQINLPFGPENFEADFQLFAPVELDLDNEPYQDDYGYFAEYNKLAWSFSGERITVGNPDVVVLAETIFYDNPGDNGDPPEPHLIANGLQDVVPDAGFAWGDRYELGYRDRGNGWVLGILDGPDLNQNQVHGMSPTLQGSSLPGTPPIDPSYTGPVSADQLYAFGFGSVHVNFEVPDGYLSGFRDYVNFLAGATIGTQGGPLLYVGNYGGVLEPDVDDDATITFFRLADDLDEDGIPGSIVIVDPVTGLLTTLTDFNDLHTFNIAFDQVVIRNRTKTSGVEAMWTHELTNRHYQAKHQNNRLELSAGARFLSLFDRFSFEADGGILGRSTFETSFNNQIVGPQVGAKWINQRQRWRFTADTRFMFGYNTQDWDQSGGIGAELIPAALNRLLYAQPTYFARGLQKKNFSPVGELRVESAYYLTQNVALRVGYTGMFVGHIRRAAPSVRYFLPDLGYKEGGTQDLIVNGVDFGVEFVY